MADHPTFRLQGKVDAFKPRKYQAYGLVEGEEYFFRIRGCTKSGGPSEDFAEIGPVTPRPPYGKVHCMNCSCSASHTNASGDPSRICSSRAYICNVTVHYVDMNTAFVFSFLGISNPLDPVFYLAGARLTNVSYSFSSLCLF